MSHPILKKNLKVNKPADAVKPKEEQLVGLTAFAARLSILSNPNEIEKNKDALLYLRKKDKTVLQCENLCLTVYMTIKPKHFSQLKDGILKFSRMENSRICIIKRARDSKDKHNLESIYKNLCFKNSNIAARVYEIELDRYKKVSRKKLYSFKFQTLTILNLKKVEFESNVSMMLFLRSSTYLCNLKELDNYNKEPSSDSFSLLLRTKSEAERTPVEETLKIKRMVVCGMIEVTKVCEMQIHKPVNGIPHAMYVMQLMRETGANVSFRKVKEDDWEDIFDFRGFKFSDSV